MNITDVRQVFERWLHIPDPGAVYVTLAAVAAHRVDGDPAWVMLVGPAGGGKTEVLNSTSGLSDVHAAATLTEASLLSGTAKKEKAADAKGGLLREVGDSGILVCKDFGSILSMHREERSRVLAALREVYDGEWNRRLGVDGGRMLAWGGKLTLIAGSTPAIDQHHAVMASLGERFVMYRLGVDDADQHARRSLSHTGKERQMRTELRDATAALFADLNLDNIPVPTEADKDRLIALSTLVVRCRSAVIRDAYSRREIELVPDAEAPGRLVGVLERLLAGLRTIGIDDPTAWNIVVKIGLDSMPVLRRRTLEHLIAGAAAQHKTNAIAAAHQLPTSTALRTLEDLAAHGLITRYSGGGPGKADCWQINDWTLQRHAAATSPETSVDHSSNTSNTTYDDFSGEVAQNGNGAHASPPAPGRQPQHEQLSHDEAPTDAPSIDELEKFWSEREAGAA